MRVVTFQTKQNQERYMVVDDKPESLIAVNRFLKFKDNAGKARNTLRTYSYQLVTFFEFLNQSELNYFEVVLDDIAAYMRWLQRPERSTKIISLIGTNRKLRNATINTYVSTVTEFYSFLMRVEDDKISVSEKLKIQIANSKRGYKDFLYHVNKSKTFEGRYLKLKEERIEKEPLEEMEIQKLMVACGNKRDVFLLHLLYESGFRIGECLSLWLEDFDVVDKTVTIVDRGELSNNAEIKTITSPRTIDVSELLINRFLDYIAEYHTEDISTNFVFFKLAGKGKGQPLDYACVDAMFRKLRKKTGIYVTTHYFRHTHFDKLRREGWGFEKIKKRGGWAHVQTPMKIYSHPSSAEIRREWERVQEKFELKEEK